MDIFSIHNFSRLCAGLWLLFSGHLAMASVNLPDPMRARDLVDLVLERSPGVAALQSVLAASEAGIKPAGSLDDPMLSYAVAPDTIDSDLGDRHIVTLSQALPWPGVLKQQSEVARNQRDAASENIAGLQLRVRAAAQSAYANWYFVHQSLAFNAENQKLMRELISVAATAYGAGRGAQQDVVGAQLREVELAQEALMLERQKAVVAAQIRELLAVDASVTIPPPVEVAGIEGMPVETELVQQAIENNPELNAMRHELRALQNRVGLAEKAFYPNFKLNAAYVGTLDPREKRTQLGVAINLPINRSKRRAEVDRRQAEQMAMQFRVEDATARISAQVGQSYARWQEAQATVELLKQRLLPLAEQNLSATRSDYSSGNGDFRAVIEAETRLLKMETMLARSQADLLIIRAEIDRLSGNRPEQLL